MSSIGIKHVASAVSRRPNENALQGLDSDRRRFSTRAWSRMVVAESGSSCRSLANFYAFQRTAVRPDVCRIEYHIPTDGYLSGPATTIFGFPLWAGGNLCARSSAPTQGANMELSATVDDFGQNASSSWQGRNLASFLGRQATVLRSSFGLATLTGP